jgi:cold shock CspA family protein
MNNNYIIVVGDVENNCTPSVFIPIVRAARNSGSLAAVMLFGNWSSPALACWQAPQTKQTLDSLGVIWSPVSTLRPGKNAADIALTYEVTLRTQTSKINQVWIVSSDSDFTPLVERLSQKQIRVVVFGSRTTPLRLRKACSSFIPLDDIRNGTRTITATTGTLPQVVTFLPDNQGWYRGFVKTILGTYGFIQVNSEQELFFCGSTLDTPLTMQHLRNGDQVQFKLGRNHKGLIAIHVRKMFAMRTA